MKIADNKAKSHIITTSLVDQVYEYLLDKIISNKISYGDTLNIKTLSETLGISTMPVREAIKRLEFERVVEVKPRSSCQIRLPDKTEIRSIYELRELLELFAIQKFLKNFDPSRLARLGDITLRMKAISDIKNEINGALEAMDLDLQFHSELCTLADNDYVCYYHRLLSLHLNMAAIHAKSYDQLKSKHFQSHFVILKNLEQKSDKALTALEEHFNNVWALL
ncbi:MAG: GntR family transcriptional regulator [Spirochaetales bacterium]|nr:MAG: GntR family transcriptional regulator [Spirochaetales bacterium]